jgi:hypothetical protein
LRQNFLHGALPDALGALGALTALRLDDNFLSGALPAGLAALLPRLTQLCVRRHAAAAPRRVLSSPPSGN